MQRCPRLGGCPEGGHSLLSFQSSVRNLGAHITHFTKLGTKSKTKLCDAWGHTGSSSWAEQRCTLVKRITRVLRWVLERSGRVILCWCTCECPLQGQRDREGGCICVGSRSDQGQSSRAMRPRAYRARQSWVQTLTLQLTSWVFLPSVSLSIKYS